MSISTPQGGGTRRPSVTKPAAGAKPKQGTDEAKDIDAIERDAAERGTATDDAITDDAAVESGESLDEVDADPRPAAKTARTVGRSKTRAPAKTVGGRPSSVKPATGKKPAGSRPASRPAGKGGSRKPITPVKVAGERNWGPIALFAAVLAVALGIIGYGGYQVWQNGLTPQQRAARIDGIQDFTKTHADLLKGAQHQWGPIKYDLTPPIGGPHNQNWQRCLGDLYDAPIANEHAVHAMEHGAVWITYRTGLPADQVETLAKKVRGNDYMLMSPIEGLDRPISIQVWGYQLKVDSASDKRIDEFIRSLRQQTGPEKGATCSSGDMITETGTTPRDLGKDGGQQRQPPAQQPGG